MSRIKIIFLFILNIVLDLVVLPRYTFFGVYPGVSIPLLIMLSMSSKKESITYYAIVLGLFKDINYSTIIGIHALSYYLISYYSYKRSIIGGLSYKLGLAILLISVIFNLIFINSLSMISDGYFKFEKIIHYFKGPIIFEILMSVIIFSIIYIINKSIENINRKKYFL